MPDWRKLFDGVYTWRVEEEGRDRWQNGYLVSLLRGTVLIDPPAITVDEQRKLEDAAYPDAVVLTHRDAAREAAFLMRRYDLFCYAHDAEANFFEGPLPIHISFEEDDYILGELEVIDLPGKTPGAMGLFLRRAGGILFVDDALIGEEDGSLSLTPTAEVWNRRRLLQSVRKLQDFDFQHILPATGQIIRDDAPAQLNLLLSGR